MKLSVDVNEHLSANVKVCVGCHGFEVDMAYFDLRAADELNFRLGRFSPSFGSFNLRHDPANQKLSDKPLPYDMGRMLRKTAWNNGVLPAPFPDNGAEINGTHWFGDGAQVDFAVFAVMGFKNDTDAHPTDLNFAEAHVPNYFVDNNGRPTTGARIALTIKTGEASDVSIGGSGLYGTYDPHDTIQATTPSSGAICPSASTIRTCGWSTSSGGSRWTWMTRRSSSTSSCPGGTSSRSTAPSPSWSSRS